MDYRLGFDIKVYDSFYRRDSTGGNRSSTKNTRMERNGKTLLLLRMESNKNGTIKKINENGTI